MTGVGATVVVDARGKTVREINAELRRRIEEGATEIRVFHPEARHNLGVGILRPVRLVFEGSVGYYCGGLSDGPQVEVLGNAGCGLGENMMAGSILVHGRAGDGVGASLRGGEICVLGHAGARTGIAMKGGLVIVVGSTGSMTGFMMQKGTLVVLGDAGHGLGDSMYEGRIFVAGEIDGLGNDAKVEEPTADDRAFLREVLDRWNLPRPRSFQKVVSGKRLYRFDKKEIDLWRQAL